jgi:hypothetical protein
VTVCRVHPWQNGEVINQISEAFLLTIAQVSATLLGLLIDAAFFYVESGLRRVSRHSPEVRSYLRSTTKAVVTGISVQRRQWPYDRLDRRQGECCLAIGYELVAEQRAERRRARCQAQW